MAIINFTGSPYSISQVGAAGQTKSWSSGSDNIQVPSLDRAEHSLWALFQIGVAGVATGQSFNGIRIQGIDDYTYAGGGGARTRIASHYAKLGHSTGAFAGFASGSGTLIASVPGSGIGASVNAVLTDGTFTSTDIANGTLWCGLQVDGGPQEAGLGGGPFRTSAYNFTMYTGSDTPTPGSGEPSGTILNPNGLPVAAGGQFAGVRADYLPPSGFGTNSLEIAFAVAAGSGLTFNGGGIERTFSKGLLSDPSNPYSQIGPAVDIAAGATPGPRTLTVQFHPFDPVARIFQITTTLTVKEVIYPVIFFEA